VTIKEAYQFCVNKISQVYSIDESKAIVKLLFNSRFDISHNQILTNGDVNFENEKDLISILERLSNSEPIQHILGYELFDDLKIFVSPDVLIPRPETAELMDWISSIYPNHIDSIADICTGSGCIALSLKKRFVNSSIIATDISNAALDLARKSELLNFNFTSINWNHHDILNDKWVFKIPQVVVCNPPYIKISELDSMDKNVLHFEPNIALFVYDEDPNLFYKKVVNIFMKTQVPDIFFELNPLTAIDLQTWCENNGLKCVLNKDLAGKFRFAWITRE
jgi:release factor glutamine methyltransferase